MGRVALLEYPRDREELERLLARRGGAAMLGYVEKVLPIVRDVFERGWEAVREYSLRFDGVEPQGPLGLGEMRRAWESISPRLRWALRVAAERLWERQRRLRGLLGGKEEDKEHRELALPLRRDLVEPLGTVGVYVPGGRFPYPSTVLHTVIPAKAAGVERVVVATPPCRGEGCGGFPVHPLVLAAAYAAGVDEVYAVGGAQAVAALASGAGPVPRVEKIVGPGNPYVQAAKMLVSSVAGVDMVAGPTELAVVASGQRVVPEQVALDLAAQAEHGPLSLSLLLTPDRGLAGRVAERLREVIGEEHGDVLVVVTRSLGEALELADEAAMEHLVLYGEAAAAARMGGPVPRAGVVSLEVPPALLDYAAGPSHVLPTGGAAAWRGGLWPGDFLRVYSLVDRSAEDSEALEAAIILAEAEGFKMHAESLRPLLVRLKAFLSRGD